MCSPGQVCGAEGGAVGRFGALVAHRVDDSEEDEEEESSSEVRTTPSWPGPRANFSPL
jgi:hypothetical protein